MPKTYQAITLQKTLHLASQATGISSIQFKHPFSLSLYIL